MDFELIKNWKGKVEIDGNEYDSISAIPSDLNFNSQSYILLKPIKNASVCKEATRDGNSGEVRIKVKRYMTQKSTPSFDFMKKWNNDEPMPLRVMIGHKVKETRGMVYMELHGDIYAEKICTCMKCGRVLTNPVSQFFGIGPECGGHNYVNPFESKEELNEAVSEYKKQLQSIKWNGWIIKSAIEEEVAV